MIKHITNFLKGIAMGAADVVPGVSGGTIAFIMGIYDRFIAALSKADFSLLSVLKKEGFTAAWKAIDGTFLASLFLGMATAIFSLSKLMKFLLEEHPIPLWAFFFGLILASSFLVGRSIKEWTAANILTLLLGLALSYYITVASPAQTSEHPIMIVFSSMLAISAMILPGISGAFIYLLLGKYEFVMNSISSVNMGNLSLIFVGIVLGLVTFAKLFSYLFKHYRTTTISLLTGFMLGSLNKVWPWREVLQTRINSHGEEVPFLDASILPSHYGGDALLPQAAVAFSIGLGIALIMLVYESKREQNTPVSQ